MDLKNGLSNIPKSLSLFMIIILSSSVINSYSGDFVFDDSEAIINNNDVRDTTISKIFENDFWGTELSHKGSHKSYRPLTILTFRFNYWLKNQLISQDFHVFNIILHILVCVLTLILYKILLNNKQNNNTSFYAAALFAVHPIHTEAVCGIVGRAELLCTLFVWMSILFYNRCIYTNRWFFQWINMFGCIICITCSVLCKETGIAAIGICAIYDLLVVNKIHPVEMISCSFKLKKGFTYRFLILFSTAMTLLLIRFKLMGFATPKFQAVDNPTSFMENILLRFINYSYIYCINIWLLLCPVWLCFDWSMGCIPLIEEFDRRIFIVIIFWLAFGTLLFQIFSNKRDVIMGLAVVIIPFLPASNIFFTVGFVVAERILYIPSAGYCLLVAIGFQKLYAQYPRFKNLVIFFFIFLIIIFFCRSWTRSNEWKTERTLFQSALRVCPLNAKVHYNVAKNAADTGNFDLARLEYEEALRLHPTYTQAMNNLGNLLKDHGEIIEAQNLFQKAVELKNDFFTAWMNLGIVLSSLKKYEQAEKSYLTALSYKSKYPDCYYNLGVLYLGTRNHSKALKAWTVATKQNPLHKRAWTNLILLLDDLGRPEDALKVANQALKHLPNDASLYFHTANVLGKSGRLAEAETYFKTAISKDSNDPSFYTNLGVLYHRWKKFNLAAKMYELALKIDSDFKSAKENLKKVQFLKSELE